MNQYCYLSSDLPVSEGDFLESRLIAHSGQDLHLVKDFIGLLADFVMDGYESQPSPNRLVLRGLTPDNPKRTKHFYRRLFDSSGCPTDDFRSWASESLALLIEEQLEAAVHSEGGSPHNNDPAFDIISLLSDPNGEIHLCIVQVKATQNALQKNANEAIHKFTRLESGDYDAELSARLELVAMKSPALKSIDFAELMYRQGRRYKLTAMHEQDRAMIGILTLFDKRVPGARNRRRVRLIRVDWASFWDTLGDAVYAHLV